MPLPEPYSQIRPVGLPACRAPHQGPDTHRPAGLPGRGRGARGDGDRHAPGPIALRERLLREPVLGRVAARVRPRGRAAHGCGRRALRRARPPQRDRPTRMAVPAGHTAARARRRAARAQVRLELLGHRDRAAGAGAGDRRARAHLVVRGAPGAAVRRSRGDRPRQQRLHRRLAGGPAQDDRDRGREPREDPARAERDRAAAAPDRRRRAGGAGHPGRGARDRDRQRAAPAEGARRASYAPRRSCWARTPICAC